MPLPSPFLFLSFFFLFFRAVSAGGWHAIKASGTVLVTGHGTKRATMPSLCISSKGSPRSLSWKRWQKPARGWKKSSWGTYAGRKANPPSLSLSRPLLLRLRETVLDRSNISLSPNLLLLLSPSPSSSPSSLDPLSVPALPIVCSFRSNKRRRDMNRFATRDLFLPSKK